MVTGPCQHCHHEKRRKPMVIMENIRKGFNGKNILDGVDFSVRSGEAIAIIGPSGSGKTTMIRIINGFVVPDSGRVIVKNKEINYAKKCSLRSIRKRVGMIYQLFNLVERSSVLQNVMSGSLGRLDKGLGLVSSTIGLFPKREKEKALELLRYVDIEDKADERVDRLSGGQKQRVAIARALMQDPEVLLADEPIANLDPKTSKRIMELLLRINMQRNITVLCVLHHPDIVKEYFNRTIALKNGKICYDGDTLTITQDHIQHIYGFKEGIECIAA